MALSYLGLVNMVIAMRASGYSWNKIQAEIAPGVSKIVFYKIATTSYEPKDPVMRHKLGLPQLQEVIKCKCGKIKTKYHECDSRSRPPRIAIRLDNPESAARSIKGHMDEELVRKLVRLLEE